MTLTPPLVMAMLVRISTPIRSITSSENNVDRVTCIFTDTRQTIGMNLRLHGECALGDLLYIYPTGNACDSVEQSDVSASALLTHQRPTLYTVLDTAVRWGVASPNDPERR